MGDVIHVQFGTERMWDEAREATIEGLVAVGDAFGDEESLMRAKADAVFQVLRNMVENVPQLRMSCRLPEDLNEEQLGLVSAAIKEAALTGLQAGVNHSIQTMMASIYDLCTSKLQVRPS